MKLMLSLSIMLSFVLLIILVLNLEDKSKIIKYSFTIFLITLFVSIFLVNELVIDYLLSEIIRYLYFPRFSSVIATIVLCILMFLYFIYSDHLSDKVRIVNYIFPCFILAYYVVFMFLNVNVDSYNALYSNDSLLCIRYITRTFTVWIIINIVIKYFDFFLKKE